MLDILAPFLDAAGVGHVRLDGSMSMEERAAAVDCFTNSARCSVFMLSLKAGGVGLHLVAATHVWLIDPWWNPMVRAPRPAAGAIRSLTRSPGLLQVEQQAFERCHRLGQTQPVTVHRLYVEDTVEQAIVSLQARKRGLAASTLAGDLGALNRLDLEDLKMLFTRKGQPPGGAAKPPHRA